jgi:hypothetical protein
MRPVDYDGIALLFQCVRSAAVHRKTISVLAFSFPFLFFSFDMLGEEIRGSALTALELIEL